MATFDQRSKIDQIGPHKLHFSSAFGSWFSTKFRLKITFLLGIWIPFIRFGQNLAWTYSLTFQTSLRKDVSFIAKSKMAARGQMSKIDQIWPHKSHFSSAFGSRSSDLDKIWHKHTSWPYKQVCARIYQLAQNPSRLQEVKGPKSTKFDPINHILARHLLHTHRI